MGLLILLGVLGLLVFWAAAYSGLLWRTRKLSSAHKAVLAKYAISYQRAHAADRQRMERIVATFVHDKDWVGAGIEVAEEMKVMISACAAQLLKGHPDMVLAHSNASSSTPTHTATTAAGACIKAKCGRVPGRS